jgi:hypothetical protein
MAINKKLPTICPPRKYIIIIFGNNCKKIRGVKNKSYLKNYSVENECPHEQLFVTFGLDILNPEPIKLSI